MQQTFLDILGMFDSSSFNTWATNNIVFLLSIVIILIIGVGFFKPKLTVWYYMLRRKRLSWEWQILAGRHMTKRARDQELANDFYDYLLDRVKKGKMTHKEKRRRLRLYEMVFELEPGTLTPKPAVLETKRRIRSRLSAVSANASSIKPIRRLAAIMNSKG